MPERQRSEEEWQTIRDSIEKAEGGEGFVVEFKTKVEDSSELLIVTDLDTNDKSLDIFPKSDESPQD